MMRTIKNRFRYLKLFEDLSDNIDIDPFDEEDWNEKELSERENQIIDFLKNLCSYANGRDVKTVYFKTPVVVGYDGKDVLCNYFYHIVNDYHEVDKIVFDILYNEKDDVMYKKSWDFTLMDQNNILYGKGSRGQIVDKIFDDVIEIIYKEASKPSMIDWIKYVNEKLDRTKYLKDKNDITWEERKELLRLRIFKDKLVNNHPYNPDEEFLKKMDEMGEEEYNKMMREHSKMIQDILDELKNEKSNENIKSFDFQEDWEESEHPFFDSEKEEELKKFLKNSYIRYSTPIQSKYICNVLTSFGFDVYNKEKVLRLEPQEPTRNYRSYVYDDGSRQFTRTLSDGTRNPFSKNILEYENFEEIVDDFYNSYLKKNWKK